MRKRFNKLLAAFVAVMLCTAMVPITAIAEGSTAGEDVAVTSLEETDDIEVPGGEFGDLVGEDPTDEPESGDPEDGEEPAGDPEENEAGDTAESEDGEAVEIEEEKPELAEDTVATVGDEQFTSLQDAANYVARTRALGNITLRADRVESVTLSMNTTYNLNGFTWTGNGGSNITCTASNVTITVNGKGTMQAAEGYRVVSVTSASNTLLLNDLTLIGSGASTASETSYRTQGGILFAYRSVVEATNCIFKNGFNTNGGAIGIQEGTLELDNCEFNNNFATSAGGAVSVYRPFNSSQKTSCNITNCKFMNNKASSEQGGAIRFDGLNDDCTIKGTRFEGNVIGVEGYSPSSSSKGGAINFSSCSTIVITIDDCKFIKNKAPYSYGGAICAYDSSSSSNKLKEININNSVFKENSAQRGGAIALRANKLTLNSTTIAGNEATYNSSSTTKNGVVYPSSSTSGGIHFFPGVNGASFNVDVNSKIYGNKVENEITSLSIKGLAVSSEVYIVDTKTMATSINGLEGMKSVDDDGSSYLITKFKYASSTSSDYKYAQRFYSVKSDPERIYLDPTGTCGHNPSENTQVFSNIDDAVTAAQAKDGKIHICSMVSITSANAKYLNLDAGSAITYIRCANNHSGAMFSIKNDASFTNVVIDGNGVESTSAMVTISSAANATVENSAVFQNANRILASGVDTDNTGGGAIEMTGVSGKNVLTFNGGVFKNNTCSHDGGAIWTRGTTVNINSGQFERNTAKRYGGAFLIKGVVNVDVTGGLFTGNTAEMGGAIDFRGFSDHTGPTSVISGGTFENNHSSRGAHTFYGGGAIYNDKGCHLTIYNAIVTNNYTSQDSLACHKAAISNCITGNLETYEVDGVLVYNNKRGGYLNDNADIGFCDELYGTHPAGYVAYSPMATVSDYALGGGEANWTDYNGKSVDRSYYQNTYNGFSIVSHPTDETIKLAEAQASVWFIGNSANQGGSAIMNNGYMTFGGDKKNLRVKKEWLEEDAEGNLVASEQTPAQIKLQLAIKYNDSDEIVLVDEETRKDNIKILNAKNNWYGYWADLGNSDDYEWTVVEIDSPYGYEFELSEPSYNKENQIPLVEYTATNVWHPEFVNISAEKFWEDQDNVYQIQPTSIDLTLMTSVGAIDANENGVIDDDELVAAADMPVTVSANDEGAWRWEFKELAKYTKQGEAIKYLVKETPVLGYTSEVVPVPATDDEGNELKDEDGNTIYTWVDGDDNEWSAFNITNTLDFADIEFTKTYEGQIYQDAAGNGNSTAVFRITGEFNGTKFYENVVSANFAAAGEQTIEVKGLLVGATYTIEELAFDGSGYVSTDNVQTFTLTKDGMANDVTVSFTNTSTNDETPNQGVINRYTFTNGSSSVEQLQVA